MLKAFQHSQFTLNFCFRILYAVRISYKTYIMYLLRHSQVQNFRYILKINHTGTSFHYPAGISIGSNEPHKTKRKNKVKQTQI